MKIVSLHKGFTLIEIILAMAIFGIILVSFLGAFTNGFTTILSMGKRTQAVAKAQAVIDFIDKEGTIEADLLTASFNINSEVNYDDLEQSIYNPAKPIFYGVASETIGNAPNEITVQKVRVLVFYQNGKRYITLTTLIP